MPAILHRFSIDAPPAAVLDLAASSTGIEQWWTGRPVTGDLSAGGQFAVFFADGGSPAATFTMVERSDSRVVWLCTDGPDDWRDTTLSFEVRPRPGGGTTLLFTHDKWAKESEFMAGCSTNWGAYLTSLKAGAESGAFAPFPNGEMSRWD